MALMSFALFGVMAMQYYFIKESYGLKSQLFDQAVNDALKNVSTKLEKKEAMVFLTQKADRELRRKEQKRSRQDKSITEKKLADFAKTRKLRYQNQTIAFVRRMKAIVWFITAPLLPIIFLLA